MQQQFDPAEALALAQRTREEAGARGSATWWYAPLLGLVAGGVVLSTALPPFLMPLGALLCMGASIQLYRAWTARTGLAVTNYQSRRTTLVSIPLFACLLAIGIGSALLKHDRGVDWAPFALAPLAMVVAALGSRLWDRAWRADLRSGA
jgi:hypothetical protein